MGADGDWQLMRREVFVAEWPDVDLREIGLTQPTVLGVEAVGRYSDTNGIDDFDYSPATDTAKRYRLLVQWLARFDEPSERMDIAGEAPTRVLKLSGYYGTEKYDEAALIEELQGIEADGIALATSQRHLEAQEWFEVHAESHRVWT